MISHLWIFLYGTLWLSVFSHCRYTLRSLLYIRDVVKLSLSFFSLCYHLWWMNVYTYTHTYIYALYTNQRILYFTLLHMIWPMALYPRGRPSQADVLSERLSISPSPIDVHRPYECFFCFQSRYSDANSCCMAWGNAYWYWCSVLPVVVSWRMMYCGVVADVHILNLRRLHNCRQPHNKPICLRLQSSLHVL